MKEGECEWEKGEGREEGKGREEEGEASGK
jgi:hypothetical protein